ncbi:Phosphoenolpyruvate:glucose-phosphotransferase regulator [Rosistilla oblonga]|uniref:zinc-dependent peptidase n=1 Tax=Rosistilla oblonga TaxID=2527990 RepID=UPI00118CB7FE|nr:zinc-dependent peptidase [Rosistilla oblonga]QDV13824.1 Phosphoenolpyruvate:glucose-phosphotransferase regulator [Rosistilla oblonga]
MSISAIKTHSLASFCLLISLAVGLPAAAVDQPQQPATATPAQRYAARSLSGWTIQIRRELLEPENRAATDQALELLTVQLNEICRAVPSAALKQLQQVTLWFSPQYPGIPPRAEYHPSGDWLRANGRDPAMARGIEFTNIRIFAAETRRMPNFALHELAHAYHHRELPDGFQNEPLRSAFEKAKASGGYDRVERQDSEGNKRFDRAYALTNPQEYFAETTEAFFTRNDFFPFDRKELQQHDPEVCQLLTKLWGVQPTP